MSRLNSRNATTYLLNCNLYLYLLGPAPWAAGLHALLAPHLHHEDKLEQVMSNLHDFI